MNPMIRPSIAGVILLGLACAGPRAESQLEEKQAEIAATGTEVMGFDLDVSTHVFEKTEDGGLQQVVSDTNDPEQVALIRAHLQNESQRFSQGNFHHPGMIHGEDMPGLHELVTGYENIEIAYGEIDAGGQIRYTSEDRALVTAIHMWFDAQLADHGEHAQPHR